MGSGPYSWVVAAWDQDTCSYTETLTMLQSDGSALPSWITITDSTRTIRINRQIVSGDHGTSYTFRVTSTLNDGVSSDNGYTFTIVMQDPCRSASLETPTLSTINVDDGSSTTASFTDASDSFGAAYFNTDACGTRTYAI